MRSFWQAIYSIGRFLFPVLILIGGAGLAVWLMLGREEARTSDRPALAKYVEVLPVTATTRPITLSAFGTVRAHRELQLQAQVSGVVLEQHAELREGAILPAGALLVRLDPRDYEAAVAQAEAALVSANFNLTIEEGRQVIAGREWELMETTVDSSAMSKDLALRKPHLKEKHALVKAAESNLARAQLDLDRTELRVPFNALVVEESIEVGQLVTTQAQIARLICVDEFHVEVSVPVADLQWVRLPAPGAGDGQGSLVRILQEVGDNTVQRDGHVVGLLGSVDPTGRMARLLVSVSDPLGVLDQLPGSAPAGTSQATKKTQRSPLLVGEYVTVEIEGPPLDNVLVVPRVALREGSTLWVQDTQSRLAVRPVQRRFSTGTEVIVDNTLEDGDAVIVSTLQVPLPGMLLTTELDATTDGTAPSTSEADPALPAAGGGTGTEQPKAAREDSP